MIIHIHFDNITLTSQWASWRLTSPAIPVFATFTGTRQRIHQSSASLAFVRGIHRWPVDSPQKGPVTRKKFPFDDVTMNMKGQMDALYTSGNNLFYFHCIGYRKICSRVLKWVAQNVFTSILAPIGVQHTWYWRLNIYLSGKTCLLIQKSGIAASCALSLYLVTWHIYTNRSTSHLVINYFHAIFISVCPYIYSNAFIYSGVQLWCGQFPVYVSQDTPISCPLGWAIGCNL